MKRTQRSYQDVRRRAACGDEVAVAAARRESVDAALEMLEAGGNAADAAVACGFVAGVVEPMETCLAGSGLLLAWDPAAHRATAVDFPPRAPLAARPEMYEVVSSKGKAKLLGVSAVRDDANTEGILAPGVPGTVAGLLAAHERLGRLDRRQVMRPAIRAATDGVAVDGYHALQILDNLETLRAHPDAAAIHLEDGLPPVPAYLGEATLGVAPLLRQPDLARTLEVVAERGPAGFYDGEIARAIERHFAAHGGLITRADLAAYRPVVGAPLRARYRGLDLLAPVSPCGAWTELQILRALERLRPAGAAADDPDAVHALVAASRRAFADRYHWLGDPDHGPVPLAGLLSDGYADATASAIRAGDAGPAFDALDGQPWETLAFEAAGGDPWAYEDDPAARPDFRPGTPAPAAADRHGTTHFAVVDGDGMMVSCTHTAGNAFGSKVVAAGTGLLFDAAMVWFNAVPGAANSIAPGKRPLVNMGPLLVVDGGRARLTVGAPGGRRIIDAVVQVLAGAIDRGLTLQDAMSTPRVDASGRAVLASERLPGETLDALRARGHRVVAIREEHAPFGYELARPVGVEIAAGGERRAGIDPFTQGHAAAW